MASDEVKATMALLSSPFARCPECGHAMLHHTGVRCHGGGIRLDRNDEGENVATHIGCDCARDTHPALDKE